MPIAISDRQRQELNVVRTATATPPGLLALARYVPPFAISHAVIV